MNRESRNYNGGCGKEGGRERGARGQRERGGGGGSESERQRGVWGVGGVRIVIKMIS